MSIVSLRSFRLDRRRGPGPIEIKLGRRPPLYVASRASIAARALMWRTMRLRGFNIVSSWIDEAGAGETLDYSDLWARVIEEIGRARAVVLYAEPDDFPLKGALVEIGAALGMRKPIVVCLPGVDVAPRSARPIGSWINHHSVIREDEIARAMVRAEMRAAAP
jgi:hypothetical protein